MCDSEDQVREPKKGASSYKQILKSSSIAGGAQGTNQLIGMLRVKVVAILLGPTGIGIVGLYSSITALVGTMAQLGMDQSGVREIAKANGVGGRVEVAAVARTLKRICWVAGGLGWLLTALMAWPLAKWTFGSTDRGLSVAAVGGAVLLTTVASGRMAMLQGMRKISDMARVQVLTSVISTAVAIGVYAWIGERGIVPVIVMTAGIQLACTTYFTRGLDLPPVTQGWGETAVTARRLASLGFAFMYGGVLAAVVSLAIRSLIVRDLGLGAGGIYQATWALSGMFGGFIVSAMGADFFPRLAAEINDDERVNQLVSEQIEIGVLLAIPGVMATIALAPWLMAVFYSAEFAQGEVLLPWFVCGVYGIVVMFPMGMIARAKAARRWIYLGQTEANVVHLGLIALLLPRFGLSGVAYAYAVHIAVHALVTYFIGRRLSGFKLGRQTTLTVASLLVFLVPAVICVRYLESLPALVCNLGITMGSTGYAAWMIYRRTGPSVRVANVLGRIPGVSGLLDVISQRKP